MPSKEAKDAFRRYVDPTSTNIRMDDAMQHREEFELQCCLHFAQDLKYTFGRDKNLLMRAWLSPLPINRRFLTLIGHIRRSYPRFEMWHRFLYQKFHITGVRANAGVLKILHETLGAPVTEEESIG